MSVAVQQMPLVCANLQTQHPQDLFTNPALNGQISVTTPKSAKTMYQRRSPGYSDSFHGTQIQIHRKTSWASTSREAKRRKDLKIRVITQVPPTSTKLVRQTSRNGPSQCRQRQVVRDPLPNNPTELLTRLYEALIMSRNCELPIHMFWSKFDTVNVDTRVMQYSIPDIEHTLSTVGVECNTTQTDGVSISTGRWLLLRNSHFLLRASHTIKWVDNPIYDAGHPALHPEHPYHLSYTRGQFREIVPVVWDWKSNTERWRWNVWNEQVLDDAQADSQGLEVEIENLSNESFDGEGGANWDGDFDDDIPFGQSISAAEPAFPDHSLI